MGKRFAIVIGVAAAGVMLLGGGQASASHVGCGETITTDTTLDSDLINCPNVGIVIGADNVTLDLNGHTIDGDGTIHPGDVGVDIDVGVGIFNHDGITVKDGSIRQFEQGLEALGARYVRLLGLHTSRNRFDGISLGAAARILVRDCSVNHNGSTGLGVGVAAGPALGGRSGRSHHVRIVSSSFRDNAGNGISSGGTTNSVIKGNLLSGNDEAAFHMGGGNHLQVSLNRVVRNGDGILVDGSRNVVIARNRITGGRTGVGIESGRGNLLAGNVVTGAATSIRIACRLLAPATSAAWRACEGREQEPGRPGSIRGSASGLHFAAPARGGGGPPRAVNTVIRGNRLRGAKDDGLLVSLTAKRTLLRDNIVRHSQDDGFDVNDRTAKLTGNRAVRNDDLGIEAVPGVIDGGGNIARHNGDPRQCTNIVCN